MQIDLRDGRPIYEQIVDYYRRLIATGVLLPGEQMPSVRALAMELSANPNTVQRAYQELERQGCIASVKGRGSFVRDTGGQKERKAQELRAEIGAILKEAEGYGIGRKTLLEPFLDGSRPVSQKTAEDLRNTAGRHQTESGGNEND
jgi:GntR family transcriptional regulator